MEGKKRKGKRELKVARGFERSRLERDLLAAAYERALPQVRLAFSADASGPAGGRRGGDRGLVGARSAGRMDSDRQVAIGGRF
jgi:hypothetical protein